MGFSKRSTVGRGDAEEGRVHAARWGGVSESLMEQPSESGGRCLSWEGEGPGVDRAAMRKRLRVAGRTWTKTQRHGIV